MHSTDILIIGGGAAGIFSAIIAKEVNPSSSVLLLEKTRTLLAKVRISGGGRCNVTHACFDPKALIQNYPRGGKELLGPFHRFGPESMIDWLERHNVELKTERDGRMFPITDSSETIIDCLLTTAENLGVEIELESHIATIDQEGAGFSLTFKNGEVLQAHSLILATGSSKQGFEFAAHLGHKIIPPVPSLFTFNVPNSPLAELSGISVPLATVSLPKIGLTQSGPLLITHFGFSGPAVLKLSSFAARELHALDYQTPFTINWLHDKTQESTLQELLTLKSLSPQKKLVNLPHFPLSKNLWKDLLHRAECLEPFLNQIPNKKLTHLASLLTKDTYEMHGKTTNKEEFVTAGGIDLKEVDFKRMESKLVKNLFFAGEILNIDGITGGFNFQNAWTTAFLAASNSKD